MRFTVQVGGKEPSRVDPYRDPFIGTFRILVNGELVAKRSAF
jgi:hypothetical protein